MTSPKVTNPLWCSAYIFYLSATFILLSIIISPTVQSHFIRGSASSNTAPLLANSFHPSPIQLTSPSQTSYISTSAIPDILQPWKWPGKVWRFARGQQADANFEEAIPMEASSGMKAKAATSFLGLFGRGADGIRYLWKLVAPRGGTKGRLQQLLTEANDIGNAGYIRLIKRVNAMLLNQEPTDSIDIFLLFSNFPQSVISVIKAACDGRVGDEDSQRNCVRDTSQAILGEIGIPSEQSLTDKIRQIPLNAETFLQQF
eukprot:GHVQ01035425.1.p1 GENE.GHVQ01035425.1~~GHVQ01035425.1.p1  ORF type:complete len:258 (-),score=25.41 GHVQ01035425.1:140-913(-)